LTLAEYVIGNTTNCRDGALEDVRFRLLQPVLIHWETVSKQHNMSLGSVHKVTQLLKVRSSCFHSSRYLMDCDAV